MPADSELNNRKTKAVHRGRTSEHVIDTWCAKEGNKQGRRRRRRRPLDPSFSHDASTSSRPYVCIIYLLNLKGKTSSSSSSFPPPPYFSCASE